MARFVIPAGATAGDTAFDGRPETWQDIADSFGVPVANLGDQWCVDNHVDGLGFHADYVAPPPFVDPGPTDRERLDAASLAGADSDLADIRNVATALGGI